MENARQKTTSPGSHREAHVLARDITVTTREAITRNTAFRISSCFDTKRCLLLVKPIIWFVNSLNWVQERTIYYGESRMHVRRILSSQTN